MQQWFTHRVFRRDKEDADGRRTSTFTHRPWNQSSQSSHWIMNVSSSLPPQMQYVFRASASRSMSSLFVKSTSISPACSSSFSNTCTKAPPIVTLSAKGNEHTCGVLPHRNSVSLSTVYRRFNLLAPHTQLTVELL